MDLELTSASLFNSSVFFAKYRGFGLGMFAAQQTDIFLFSVRQTIQILLVLRMCKLHSIEHCKNNNTNNIHNT